jgi:LuxR family maltose regulon positive regulatory protein
MDSTNRKSIPLINTKFSIPRVSSGLIPRPHLIERLNVSLNRKLSLICAPAGYGKTTLLSQWLADIPQPIAWLSLDENDNDLDVFLGYFLATLQTIIPAAGQETLSLLQAPQKLPLEQITITLVNELAKQHDPFVIILDDYHNITDSEVHQFMDAMIAYMPPAMHLVVASRKDLPLPLVRLRIGREMTEIRTMELRFSSAETKVYLELHTGRNLSRETVAELEGRTEGWIAALRLAAIAMRGEGDPERFVRSFKGSHRDLMDYLVSEVLYQQSDEVQEFLLRTSILDRFCADLCDNIFNSLTSNQRILNYLEDSNLFIVPLDNERVWYRYHHLFRELLSHRLLAKISEEEIHEMHLRSSIWLTEQNYDEEALHHALAAGEIEHAVGLVKRQQLDLVNREAWWEMDRWLGMLPDDVIQQQPSLLVMQAWSFLFKFQLSSLPPLLLNIESMLAESDKGLSKNEKRSLRAEMDVQHSFVYYIALNDLQKSLELGERALENLSNDNATGIGLALAMVSMAQQEMGRGEEAIKILRENIKNPTAENAVVMQAYIALCFIHLSASNLDRLSQSASYFLETATEMRQSPEIAWALYFIGLTYYEWDELDKALQHFSKGIELRYKADFLTSHLNFLAQAMTYQAIGSLDDAQEVINKLHHYSLELKTEDYLADIYSLQARFSLQDGDVLPAKRWADSAIMDEKQEHFTALEIPSLTWARIRIEEGSPDDLQEVIDILILRLKGAEKRYNNRRQIQILAHLALAYQSQNRVEEALDSLAQAISIAQPGGFIRTFVDMGLQFSGMLRQLANQGVAVHYIKQILAAFPESELMQVSRYDDPAQFVFESSKAILVEPLTRRESEILLHMSVRRTNKEIADNLTISILTVKKHSGNIYQKLGVNRRSEAVEKAKLFGILPT